MNETELKSKAAETLVILAIWGFSRGEALRMLNEMHRSLEALTPDEFRALAGGAHLKPGAPDIVHPSNDDHALKRR